MMDEYVVDVTVPGELYHQLDLVARAAGWTLQEVLLRTLRSGMPPVLDKVPVAFHDALLSLNELDDQELWRVVMGERPLETPLSPAEKRADLPTLRRSYAFALLKWRGHPVPLPYEIFVE